MRRRDFLTAAACGCALSATGLAAASSPAINANDYGAMGDGVSDDTVALQAALDAATAAGGTLRLPAGRYVVTQTLVALGACTIVGEGVDATILFGPSMADAPVLACEPDDNGYCGADLSFLTISGQYEPPESRLGEVAVDLSATLDV